MSIVENLKNNIDTAKTNLPENRPQDPNKTLTEGARQVDKVMAQVDQDEEEGQDENEKNKDKGKKVPQEPSLEERFQNARKARDQQQQRDQTNKDQTGKAGK